MTESTSPPPSGAPVEADPVETSLDAPPAQVLDSLATVAQDWGAEWRPESQRLYLPVIAGLRQGLVELEVTVKARTGAGPPATRLTLLPVAETYHLNTSAVGVLVISALGGLMVLVWPFFPAYPELVQLAPLGAILALVGWFLVISRLTNQGPEELLGEVRERVTGPEDDASVAG